MLLVANLLLLLVVILLAVIQSKLKSKSYSGYSTAKDIKKIKEQII